MLYQRIDDPSFEKELDIGRVRAPQASPGWPSRVTAMMQEPGAPISPRRARRFETIDWANALVALDRSGLDREAIEETLGVVLKAKEDVAAVRGTLAAEMLDRALARSGSRA